MLKGDKIFDIPLLGEGINGKVERVSGVKKIRKLLQNHGAHIRVVHVRKTEDYVSPATNLENEPQDDDAGSGGDDD